MWKGESCDSAWGRNCDRQNPALKHWAVFFRPLGGPGESRLGSVWRNRVLATLLVGATNGRLRLLSGVPPGGTPETSPLL